MIIVRCPLELSIITGIAWLGFLGSAYAQAVPPQFQWKITKLEWSVNDEKAYSDFVAIIGEGVENGICNSVNSCLNGRLQHPYRSTNPAGLQYRADCADLPYYLRAYFAWKNGLPFGTAANLTPRSGPSPDLRYSRRGNLVQSRVSIVQRSESAPIDIRAALTGINNKISTAHFRALAMRGDPQLPDFYPVKIEPSSIRPGTTIYDPAGHAAVVYRVSRDGRVSYIDAHPDNSLTEGDYGSKFTQSSHPLTAPGFKNWRALRLQGARVGRNGQLIGGIILPDTDADHADFHVEQYVGNVRPLPNLDNWRSRRFRINGRDLSFHEFVRQRLAGGNLRYDPLIETANLVDGLCGDLRDRVAAVSSAIHAGMDRRQQPVRFPENIYGTSGAWEEYSTPSRDARMKVSFKELRDEIVKYMEMFAKKDPRLDYNGSDLARDLFDVYVERAQACVIAYERSDGTMRSLTLDEVAGRLFNLGFDPYHCAERRWGGTRTELATCRDNTVKQQWYDAEQRLRNQSERQYEVRMDFTLAELQRGGPGTGVNTPPDIDVRKALGLP